MNFSLSFDWDATPGWCTKVAKHHLKESLCRANGKIDPYSPRPPSLRKARSSMVDYRKNPHVEMVRSKAAKGNLKL